MTPRIALALLTVSLLMQSPVGRAENADPAGAPLGRLFLTPEFRTALERQRQLNIQQSRTLEGETLRLDGVVVRSSGKSTVWINSQPQTESTRDSGVAATTSRRQPGRATVSAGAKPPVDLKVGATLNQATGEKSGGLTSGEIRVKRPAKQ
jgi:hypothetical protein